MSKLEMLTPQNSAIALIDYQPAMYQGVQSHDRLVVFNNIQILAKTAKLFKIPTVLTTVAKDTFSGPFMPEVTELFPNHDIVDRTSMNSWLDAGFRKAVAADPGFGMAHWGLAYAIGPNYNKPWDLFEPEEKVAALDEELAVVVERVGGRGEGLLRLLEDGARDIEPFGKSGTWQDLCRVACRVEQPGLRGDDMRRHRD